MQQLQSFREGLSETPQKYVKQASVKRKSFRLGSKRLRSNARQLLGPLMFEINVSFFAGQTQFIWKSSSAVESRLDET